MSRPPFRRAVAVLAAAILLASLAIAAVAAPASAAGPKCAGRVATILGTNKSEVIRGTAKADVIVARGGHDRIYGLGGNDVICGNRGNDRIVGGPGRDLLFGQVGRDRLSGGPHRDRLLGGPSNDSLDGGRGNDACFQGSGIGPRVNCERPATVGPGILALAYADLDGTHSFTPGDVMISRLVDANGDGKPGIGDIVEMGRYPTNTSPAPSHFADWLTTSHVVSSVSAANAGMIEVYTTAGGRHRWRQRIDPHLDSYEEQQGDALGPYSGFLDDPDTPTKIGISMDEISAHVDSPSRPAVGIAFTQVTGSGDDRFIDVEIP